MNGYVCTHCGAKISPGELINAGPCCTLLCPLCGHRLTSDSETAKQDLIKREEKKV
jgi:DNA-directed RNA polymerase subunit RPC12/RpoP